MSTVSMMKLASSAYDMACERYGAHVAYSIVESMGGSMVKFASQGGRDLSVFFDVMDQQVVQEFDELCWRNGTTHEKVAAVGRATGDNPWLLAASPRRLEKQANVMSAGLQAANAVGQGVQAATKKLVGGAAGRATAVAKTQRNLNVQKQMAKVKQPRGSFSGQGGYAAPKGNELTQYQNAAGQVATGPATTDAKLLAQKGYTQTAKTQNVTTGSGKQVTRQVQQVDPNAQRYGGKDLQIRKAEAKARNQAFADKANAQTQAQGSMGTQSENSTRGMRPQSKDVQNATYKSNRRAKQRFDRGAGDRVDSLERGIQKNRADFNDMSESAFNMQGAGGTTGRGAKGYDTALKEYRQNIQQKARPVKNNVTKKTNTGTGQANAQTLPADHPRSNPWFDTTKLQQGWDKTKTLAKQYALPVGVATGVGMGGYGVYRAAQGGAQQAQQAAYSPEAYGYNYGY